MNIKISFYIYIVLFFSSNIFAKEYTIGVENINYSPYFSVNKRGEYIGFARDVFDTFARKKNIKFIYEVRTVKRLHQEFINEKKFDFKFPANKLWKVESKKKFEIFYSLPVCNFIDGMIVSIVNKDKDIDFFKKDGIGIVRGFTLVGYEGLGIPVSESPNISTLIQRLRFDRIKGAYFNIIVALQRINSYNELKNKFVFNSKVPYHKSSYHLSTFNHQDILYDFNRFLSENRDEIKMLKVKYGIQD